MRHGSRLRAAMARLAELVRGRRIRDDLDDEFAFHLQMEVAHNERQGMSHDEAVRAANLAFGGTQKMREATLDARGYAGFSNTVRDLRFAVRRLQRRPGFAFASVATVALAIAATSAVGLIVYTVLFKPLPYPDADRLVVIGHDAPGINLTGAGQAGAIDALYRNASTTLETAGVYLENGEVAITDGDQPERIVSALVPPHLLHLLGARAQLGQLFALGDVRRGAVIISHGLWQRRYGGDSAIIGKPIELNRQKSTIVGVMAPSFGFPRPDAAVWYALGPDTTGAPLTRLYYSSIAKLKPGVTADQAQRELASLLTRLPERVPGFTPQQLADSRLAPRVRGLRESMTAGVRSELVVLGVSVGVLLLIAVVNLVNLFLLRSESVRREVAVSRALGARGSDIVRRFFTEGFIVAGAGGLLALPLAAWGVTSHFGFTGRQVPRLDEVAVDWRLFAVVLGLSLVIAAILCASSTARTHDRAIGDAVRGGSRATGGRSWAQVQRTLVGAQVALALAVLASSALAGKSMLKLLAVDLHFDASRTLVFDLPLPFGPYRRYVDGVRFHEQLLDSLRAVPGVVAAEAAGQLPLRGEPSWMIEQFVAAGDPGRSINATVGFATPDYFTMLSIPLLQGRAFEPSDLREAPGVIVSRSVARALGGDRAVGSLVRYGDNTGLPAYEVIGVVEDQYGASIAAGTLNVVYFPIAMPAGSEVVPKSRYIPRGGTSILVKAAGDPRALVPVVRRVLRDLDPQLPMANVTTLDEMVDASTARARLVLLMLAIAAGTSLLLGMLGLYGVIAWSVATRHRELGIRIAIGATPEGVLRTVLGEGAVVTLLGIAAGLALAVASGRVMGASLFQVQPFDPGVLALASVLTVLIAAVATWVPARRASAIDPVVALRSET